MKKKFFFTSGQAGLSLSQLETLCPQPFAYQEGFISFQCPNLQRAIT